MNIITQEQLIRNLMVMNNGEFDFFLGSGASIQSGIPTGGNLVWHFKREIYCSENNLSKELFKDLKLHSVQSSLQEYFDMQGTYPNQYSPSEYAHYFEKCYNNVLSRKRFIEELVKEKNPSIGYLCLAHLIIQSKISNIWTTNFDSLIEAGLSVIDPNYNSYVVYSSANQSSFATINPSYPIICKMHGDFRYDKLQNTESELQTIESTLYEQAKVKLCGKGLVVIGYSGSDESIMSFFEENIDNPDFLSKGLYWMVHRGSAVSARVADLLQKAIFLGKDAAVVDSDGFDSFFYSTYKSYNAPNDIIENKWKTTPDTKKAIIFNGNKIDSFIKLNAHVAKHLPLCHVFETDISSWKQLKLVIGTEEVIAALYAGRIYCFASTDRINSVFKNHIKSTISLEMVEERILNKGDSIYLGMLYQLLKKNMIEKGMVEYKKNKYYNAKTETKKNGYIYYNAVEFAFSYIDKKVYLNIIPTIHIIGPYGKNLDQLTYQRQVNYKVSNIYNSEYNELLKDWEALLRTRGRVAFGCDNFKIEFISPAISCGGIERNDDWPSLQAWIYPEPLMSFSEKNKDNLSIAQLKGLVRYGPIDYSYTTEESVRPPIQLAVLAPKEKMQDILSHLNKLNVRHSSSGKDRFLVNYESFSKSFRRQLIVPTYADANICIGYKESTVLKMKPIDFLAFLKRGIDSFELKSTDFDILIIYVPDTFKGFRESKEISVDFNLHDAVKLYATDRGVKVQFIEERSTKAQDICKVMWGLSTSIYAKSSGVLWHPFDIENGTAYVGVSYAQSVEKGICIGCSQLFDSTGTGIKMILRKIDNPLYCGNKNPYMNRDEARTMMTELREQYYRSNPTAKLNRIVVHKTTPFLKDEIIGITQAFEGIDNIELLQIQTYSPWRALKFGKQASQKAENFAVKRGTTIQLSDDSFLLWTHGSIIHQELAGNLNYYKNSRGIPTPLFVKRYHGKSSGDILVKEILMLTKMNWNSGDSLYKVLPVTLDYAKVLSRMSKQDEAIYNKAYDFRYFM